MQAVTPGGAQFLPSPEIAGQQDFEPVGEAGLAAAVTPDDHRQDRVQFQRRRRARARNPDTVIDLRYALAGLASARTTSRSGPFRSSPLSSAASAASPSHTASSSAAATSSSGTRSRRASTTFSNASSIALQSSHRDL